MISRLSLTPGTRILCRSLSRRHRLAGRSRLCVRNRGWNSHFDFCTGTEFTPDRQLSARQCGALLYARHTVMPGAAAGAQDLRVDALSVVADAQSEPPLI